MEGQFFFSIPSKTLRRQTPQNVWRCDGVTRLASCPLQTLKIWWKFSAQFFAGLLPRDAL